MKQPRVFGRPRLSQTTLSFTLKRPAFKGRQFQTLPAPTGPPPFHLDLKDVVPGDLYKAIARGKRMVFHTAGDLGGIKFAVPQQLVADGLERDFDPNAANPADNPAFFYGLGDCVYYNGQGAEYFAQFYQPYEHYLAPIFAVPGNHDGDAVSPETSLEAFKRNFCSPAPVITQDAGESSRHAMTQPNVFWTLITPVVNFVGLYTNVPEGGELHQDQIDWLAGELRSLDRSVPLIVTMHHPIYSADDHHSGSQHMRSALNDAVKAARGRYPDMVLAGHVHDYQRFTHRVGGRQIPYIVAGAGGYWHLHKVARVDGERLIPPQTLTEEQDTVTLEQYLDDRHGFLRLEVAGDLIIGKYYGVPRPQESWSGGARLVDSFQFNWRTHRLV